MMNLSIQAAEVAPSEDSDHWRSKASLSGRTFLITRSAEGNMEERKKLEALGAKVVDLESIKISPPSSWEKLDEILPKLHEIDWIIFTSPNGVRFFFERFSTCRREGKKAEQTNIVFPRFACIGPSTARALESEGYISSFQPTEFLSTSLGEELSDSFDIAGKKILLARAERVTPELGNLLRKAGAIVVEVPVYSTSSNIQQFPVKDLDIITDITLMSSSAVDALLGSIPSNEIVARGIRVYCIGPVTASVAKRRGLESVSISAVHTLDGLVTALIES